MPFSWLSIYLGPRNGRSPIIGKITWYQCRVRHSLFTSLKVSISCTEVVCNHKLYYALDDDIVIDFSVFLCSYQVFMNIMYIISVGSEGSSRVAFF